jgi:hypothetical protein
MELGQWQPLPNRRRLRYRPAVFLSHLRLSGLQFTQKKKKIGVRFKNVIPILIFLIA